jgi:TPR repeat protein
MVAIAQWLERCPVEAEVAGSSPVSHPIFIQADMETKNMNRLLAAVLVVTTLSGESMCASTSALSDAAFVEQLKRNAVTGDASAQGTLGALYQYGGQGVHKDLQKAFAWNQKAANGGDFRGQRNLGLMYRNATGVSKNDRLAAQWLEKAATQGDSIAQGTLGVMYQLGLGVSQDYEAAAKWLKRAADQGYEGAQAILGNFYVSGTGVPKDRYQGYFWLSLAVLRGYRKAESVRDELAKSMSMDDITKTQLAIREWQPKLERPAE